MKDDIMVWTAF